ncbi:MAG: hypothetical protein QM778_28500 [Myxococcales bacterium]
MSWFKLEASLLRSIVGKGLLGSMLALALQSGCGLIVDHTDAGTPLEPAPPALGTPELVALSSYSSPLGRPIRLFGTNFRNAVDERGLRPLAAIGFEGTFEGHDGSVTQVRTEELLEHNAQGGLVLTTLGPYRHPFSDRRVVGTFRGQARLRFFAVSESLERGELLAESAPRALTFTVEPSIFITDFLPLEARCVAPVQAALAGLPYEIAAEAVGFEADSFRFVMEPNAPRYDDVREVALPGPVILDVPAVGNRARAGTAGGFLAPRIVGAAPSSPLQVSAIARGTDGRLHDTQFGIVAYDPIVTYEFGPAELAETLEPMVIGACQEGAIAPIQVTYTDSESVTRARSESKTNTDMFSRALESGASEELGDTQSDSSSYLIAATTTDSNETTDKFEVGVVLGLEKKIGIENGPRAEFKLQLSFKYARANSVAHSASLEKSSGGSTTLGRTRSTTDSETLNKTQAITRGVEISAAQSSSQLTEFSISADIFPNTGAVWYRQESRYLQRAVIVRYSLCGEEQVIGESRYPDYRWSVELAAGTSCTPLPMPTDLKPAQCYMPPCK